MRVLEQDRSLKTIIEQVGTFPLKPIQPRAYFPILVNSIISQMLSLKAAATIQRRLSERLKPGKVEPSCLLKISLKDLKSVGLSTTKAEAIHDLARRTMDGILPLKRFTKMENDEIINHLVEVRGIGQWTAEMFLMFGLVRPDVWPIDDLGLRAAVKKMDRMKVMPDKKYMMDRGEVYTPYRTVASWYLWQSLKLPE
jgi:3-methyladenine DNA glycosylase/8-oxoguanine DNA glycosylase